MKLSEGRLLAKKGTHDFNYWLMYVFSLNAGAQPPGVNTDASYEKTERAGANQFEARVLGLVRTHHRFL